MEFYPWVVVGHVVFVILAFGAHGVSAFAMFRVKAEPDRARAAAVLDLSTVALAAAGIGLVVAVLLGIVAAVMGGLLRAAVAVGGHRRRRAGLAGDDAAGRESDERGPPRTRAADP